MRHIIKIGLGVFVLFLSGITAAFVGAVQPTADELEVISDTTIAMTMPGAEFGTAVLAPNGERFLWAQIRSVCIYTIAGVEEFCIDISDTLRMIDSETVRWSSDSRYVAFTDPFFSRFVDSAVWVLDVEAQTLVNVSGENADINLMTDYNWDNVDVLPNWLPDNRIMFLRFSRADLEIQPPVIYTVAPDGTGLEQVGSLLIDSESRVTAVDVSSDAGWLAYNYVSGTLAYVPEDGVWVSDFDGTNALQLLVTDIEGSNDLPEIHAVAISADDQYVIILFIEILAHEYYDFEGGAVRVLALPDGDLLQLDNRFVTGAGWSPSGSAIAYLVHDPENADNSGLYIMSAPGESGRQVLQGEFITPTEAQNSAFVWSENNVILLAEAATDDDTDLNLRVVQLG